MPAERIATDGAGASEPLGLVVPSKFYRVGEIIEHTGVSRQTLHTYTLLGLITEERTTRGGHRLYGESVFARLRLIEQMKREGKTLREIRLIFDAKDKGVGA